jgi:adenylate cyclase
MKWEQTFKYKIQQVLFITFCWVMLGFFVELYNAVNYDDATGKYFLYFPFGQTAWEHLLITAIGPAIGGLFAGSFIIFYQRENIKGKTYRQKLLIHSFFYILFLSACILLVGIIGAFNNSADGTFLSKLYSDIFSLRVLRLVIVWYFIVTATSFLLDVSETYGVDRLKRILGGKYHTLVKEERIFLFLDLKSSTKIAEQIGEERYFKMLRFFYKLANVAVLNNRGEIYQYVGDEIVISWDKKLGLKNGNCLNCFFAIKKIVAENGSAFMEQFNTIPDFKCAIHTGTIASGVIGTVKRDIVYSGDVLNTTARIIALCNHYGKSLMISEDLYNHVEHFESYHFEFVDDPVLRGKKEKTGLYAVEPISDNIK